MRVATLFSTVLLIVSGAASAQISVSVQEFFPRIDGEHSASYYQAQVESTPALKTILTQTGPNQTYDFTTASFMLAGTFRSRVQSTTVGTPGATSAFFAASNFVTIPLDVLVPGYQSWSFHQLDGNDYRLLGSIVIGDFNFDQVPDTSYSEFDPADVVYQFPLEYGDSWSQSYTIRDRSIFGVTETRIEESVVIDSWGQLITAVRSRPALRMVETRTSISTTADTSTTVQVSYITEGSLYAWISTDNRGNVYGAAYGLVDDVATAVEDPGHPRGFELGANYPNPFDRETYLPFTTDRSAHVELALFDVLGRRVTTLANGLLPAGSHTSRLDAAALPNGLYVARLTVDGMTQARQIILSR